MTEDEQEALSFRYVMPRIMRLSSGNIALFVDGEPPRIIKALTNWDKLDLYQAIPTTEAIEAYQESLRVSRPEPSARITSLNLADLGL